MKDKISLYICIVFLVLFSASFRWPAENITITSTFGESRGNHFHDGMDVISSDRKIYPVADGELFFFWDRSVFPLNDYPGLGNYRIVRHNDTLYSLYAHLEDDVPKKYTYSSEDLLGMMANTGRSYGRHLHFTLIERKTGKSVNPMKVLPGVDDIKPPVINGLFIRIDDHYYSIREGSNIRLTRHYPLLIDIFDSIKGSEKCGVYSLDVSVNDKKVYSVTFDAIGNSKNGLTISGNIFHSLFDEKGYYKIPKVSYRDGVNTVTVSARDFSGHTSTKKYSFNVKLEI